jgi:hypothetical protein
MKHRYRTFAVVLAIAGAASAADIPSYGSDDGYSISPPYDAGSFSSTMTAFPIATKRTVGGYPLASRLLAASGRTVSLQKTFGASDWLPVATIAESDPSMDPCFVVVTPNGEKVALGTGFVKPLYVFSASLLSVANPVVLTTSASARRYDLEYYSAAFRDNRYLFLNVGGKRLGLSYVSVIDTESPGSEPKLLVADIPGASAGITFDAHGNLVTGIGWDEKDVRAGEVALFDAAAIDAALATGSSLEYDADERVLATDLLSADSLGFDGDGNLYVGGGDVFGTSGRHGYAQIVGASVVSRVLAGGPPADSADPKDVMKLSPDPCHNDDWTGITFVPGVETVIVSANLASTPPDCAAVDWSSGPSTAASLYFPPGAPDSDHDGIPDGADPDYQQQQLLGPRELSRLVDALDSTKADANYDASVDYDASDTVDDGDFAFLRAHWGMPVPDGSSGP